MPPLALTLTIWCLIGLASTASALFVLHWHGGLPENREKLVGEAALGVLCGPLTFAFIVFCFWEGFKIGHGDNDS